MYFHILAHTQVLKNRHSLYGVSVCQPRATKISLGRCRRMIPIRKITQRLVKPPTDELSTDTPQFSIKCGFVVSAMCNKNKLETLIKAHDGSPVNNLYPKSNTSRCQIQGPVIKN